MKRIRRAINEGTSLINFSEPSDNESMFRRHGMAKTSDLYVFESGDYVYYSDKYGYTNDPKLGRAVAICIVDGSNNNLYAVLNHPLLYSDRCWANFDSFYGTRMYDESFKDLNNGWENTERIRHAYPNALEKTIFDPALLKQNEYIPCAQELLDIHLACLEDESLADRIGIKQADCSYWSSSENSSFGNIALSVGWFNQTDSPNGLYKNSQMPTVPLLHLDD